MEELRNFFKKDYKSIINVKIIYDQNTKISKGFGFIDFSDYKEYLSVLKTNKKLRNSKLIIK